MAHPAFAQPLIERSPNRSNRQRNQMKSALIQMKNQKLHSSTSPKSFVMLSMSEGPLTSRQGRERASQRCAPTDSPDPGDPAPSTGPAAERRFLNVGVLSAGSPPVRSAKR